MFSTCKRRRLSCLLVPVFIVVGLIPAQSPSKTSPAMKDMILVHGGVFQMGDVFEEGAKNERPVHEVRLSDFYLNKYETTVAQYKAFVEATGYVTRAERLDSREKQQERYTKLLKKAMAGQHDEEFLALYEEFLNSGGCHFWTSDPGSFKFSVDCNWKTPLVEQTQSDPVVCIGWVDAASYCNWLSEKEGLPPAYDMNTGELLDGNGKPTTDVGGVKGYRLPTEAEWEYAAREGGKKVRFGNGKNVARAGEMNFNAVDSDYEYSEAGLYRGATAPVGSFEPNGLGLCDMSGNAWEWCSDFYGEYNEEHQVNPYRSTGKNRVLRGGRWGGNASEARAFSRYPYRAIDRCNNSGFRIAKTR
jgi:formylglycine-generating enzyme required for sulfatase activity